MKKPKIIFLTIAISMLSAGSFAQLRYGLRGEMSLNNPTIEVPSLDMQLKQEPVFLFGVGGELDLSVNNLSLEGALLYGNEKVSFEGEGVSKKSQVKTHYIDVPLTANMRFDIGAPVMPVISAGPVFKMYVSENDGQDKTIFDKFNKDEFLVGIIAGAGVEIMNMVTVCVNYRHLLSGENRRLADEENYQKGLITLSAKVYF